eukprot:CAMPEP_0203668036 /NCGR_PEP_ID=MMETSP0090-20130426/4748_1 /ASSEMBLY_ACC=CAM_ASM_001088 /TAXON_ID=426623 /ORGANISM="Chaetoceros affinis, Strain CCMP159" /LENGTH=355 /DNA_ID=CAMNT_0050532357 /DNA_START=63 /DNA_END=1130 /DNA_ORIENTATION=-
MHSTFGPSSTQNGFIPNDENAIPMQQQLKKHTSTKKGLSSSSSALKSKKGSALQPINSNLNNVGSFPKTPLSSSTTKKGNNTNTSRRRALGDISNRKGSGGITGFASSAKGNNISKGGNHSNIINFHIHDSNATTTKKNKTTKKKKKPLSSLSINNNITTSSSTSTSSHVKKKSVVFQDQIYNENNGNDSNSNLKIPQQQLPKKNKGVLKSKSINSSKGPSSLSSRRMMNLSAEGDYIDDFDLSFPLPKNKEDILQDDLYIGDIDERDKLPDIEQHEKMMENKYWLQQQKEFEETIRKGDEIMAKKIEMLQNDDVEEDDFYIKVFEDDEFSDKLNIFDDEEEDIPYYDGLDDLSI